MPMNDYEHLPCPWIPVMISDGHIFHFKYVSDVDRKGMIFCEIIREKSN